MKNINKVKGHYPYITQKDTAPNIPSFDSGVAEYEGRY